MAMTTATETLTKTVARRLREQMGGRRISQKRLGQLTGWSAMYVSRRYAGDTALDVNDLETIESVTGISPQFLLTGQEEPRTNVNDWVDASALDGGAERELWVRHDGPPPHPMRRREDRLRLLRSMGSDEVAADQEALAYVRLADDSLLPRLASIQEPSGCRSRAHLALAS